jgi:lipopolysaccharide/colanic/teichoic acid biosynthesis glycosyltransferase
VLIFMYKNFIKRILDIVLVSIGVILISPVLLFTAILVRTKLGSPILFCQERPGYQGEIFLMYKFRTMTSERDSNGELLPDIDRLPAFGKFLRSTSLDELPGLFNVFKGDMSLIGPRPLLTQYLTRYSPHQARRHEVKPGITGWAQVNGRNAIEWEKKFDLDVWYVDNVSPWLDLKILLMTIIKVVKRDGIDKAGLVAMEEFKG